MCGDVGLGGCLVWLWVVVGFCCFILPMGWAGYELVWVGFWLGGFCVLIAFYEWVF